MKTTIKIYRVAKSNDVYTGPFMSDEFNPWEMDVGLMDLTVVVPKDNWLCGFTETQMQLYISKKVLRDLVNAGYSLYVFELPLEAVELFDDQVTFSAEVMDQVYQYEYDKVA